MDIYKHLVILKGIDKTDKINKYEKYKNKVGIWFYGNEQEYLYSKSEFEIFTNPEEKDIKEYEFCINGEYEYNIEKVLKFDKYYKIFKKNKAIKIFKTEEVALVKKSVTTPNNLLEYFEKISKIVSITTEEGKFLLTKEYEKIDFCDKNSALYKYLNTKKDKFTVNHNTSNLIFPFGSNKSQYSAVKKALTNQISVIEGPPGTGKTQTILNIISNVIKTGKNVAVVSNNNSAIENVYEKLKNNSLDYICAFLGKVDNKIEFINNQTGLYPKFENSLINEQFLEEKVGVLNNELQEIFTLQNDIANLKSLLEQVRLEHKHFDKYEKSISIPRLRKLFSITPEKVLNLKIDLEEITLKKKNVNLIFKMKSIFLYGIGDLDFYKKDFKNILKSYNKLYYIAKENELIRKINEKVTSLEYLNNGQLQELINISFDLFNNSLKKRYSNQDKRKIFNIKDLLKYSDKFIEEYPVVFSTTHSIKSCLNSNFKFDYIIMDEASQVDLITGIIALSCAKNAVIVGDLKQLPNVISKEQKSKIELISRDYQIKNCYNYLNNCFLSSIIKTLDKVPRTLLKEHYRCHPKIINFCNKKFYNDELIIMTKDDNSEDVLKAYVTALGNHARGHLNQRQVDCIKKEVIPELTKHISDGDIGIISPYRAQKSLLEKDLREKDLQIDTVHKFQGREKDAIIVTTVDNEISEFVNDPKMLNVAITRAKKYLRVVVSNNEKNEGSNISDLLKYIRYNNLEIVQSKLKSIYDLLYKDNEIAREKYLKGKKKISDFDSENITYNKVLEIIKELEYDNLDVTSHIPLMDLFSEYDILTEEEKIYISNYNTHIDIVVYNKLDKRMILGIEVDGYDYHKEGTRQWQRDTLKNSIFEKYNVPLIRLNTTGSCEKEILQKQIQDYFCNI